MRHLYAIFRLSRLARSAWASSNAKRSEVGGFVILGPMKYKGGYAQLRGYCKIIEIVFAV